LLGRRRRSVATHRARHAKLRTGACAKIAGAIASAKCAHS